MLPASSRLKHKPNIPHASSLHGIWLSVMTTLSLPFFTFSLKAEKF
jgi:hypothetical protein